jgi:tryptophan synthase alpha chain
MSQKLHRIFQSARKDHQCLFLPYICLGYPDYDSSLLSAKAALRAGAAALELGIPFSDPIADGPTLQEATKISLEQGTRLSDVFHFIKDLRKDGFIQPLLVMSYLNLIEQMGWKNFAVELSKAGGDGTIVPDLSLQQFDKVKPLLKGKDLSLIPFVAPTSNPDRMKKADAQGAPFLYYVSVTGVTGARKELPAQLFSTLKRMKALLKTPVVVGFGISTPEQAAKVGKSADGVIIASALIQVISKTKRGMIGKAVEQFCGKVLKALKK